MDDDLLRPSETLLEGRWILEEGRMVADPTARRIERLATDHLRRLGASPDGWDILYRDPRDGRLWELVRPVSGMQGGGPPTLRRIAVDEAVQKYGEPSDTLTESGMIEAIQHWYRTQCDGDWEHRFGIVIETLDNPGWSVRIDLTGTALEGVAYTQIEEFGSELDWISCKVRRGQWQGHCGPLLLGRVLEEFLDWAREHPRSGVT